MPSTPAPYERNNRKYDQHNRNSNGNIRDGADEDAADESDCAGNKW